MSDDISKILSKINISNVSDGDNTGEVNSWVSKSKSFDPSNEDELVKAILDLNSHLSLRTYIVGNSVTSADVAIWIELKKNALFEAIIGSNKRLKYRHLVRWFNFLSTFEALSSLSLGTTGDAVNFTTATFDDLGDQMKGKIVTRFPPEPSGFLHIGHCKAAFMNAYYAKRYGGRLIVRFDDTNPRKEKEEYEDAIIEDLKKLDVIPQSVSHTSDYFEQILQKADELIKVGKAYCDPSTGEEVSAQRRDLVPSPFRDTSVEENLKIWEEMKKATPEGQRHSLRAKIDYASPNGTMRDPVIYRYVDIPHNRTGNKFNVYPIYNFSCPVVDSIEGVTHALRSNEYHDSNEQYYWFLNNIPGIRKDILIKDFSRVNFTYTFLSKRKLQVLVDKGLVDGWDDPRFPTVQGMFRRGLTLSALKSFILDQGDAKNTVAMDILKLWSVNKGIIDTVIPRYSAIRKDSCVVLTIDGVDKDEVVDVPRNRKTASLGTKKITRSKSVIIEQEDAKQLKENEEITLMNWGNVIITSIQRDGDKVVSLSGKLHLEGDFKKTTWKLHWLPSDTKSLVDVSLVEYDTIINVKSIPKEDDWSKYINWDSKHVTEAWGEPTLNSLNKGDALQFERLGYFKLDIHQPKDGVLVFVDTPDGHLKNVFLSKKVAAKKT